MNNLSVKKVCIIGAGNMTEALLKGLLSSKKMTTNEIILAENNPKRRSYMQETYEVQVEEKFEDLVQSSDIIVLAVKPQNIHNVLVKIKSLDLKGKLIISIVAGTSISYFEKQLGAGVSIVRVMPNMGAFIMMSISAISTNRSVSNKELELVKDFMSSVGEVLVLPEEKLDAVTAISGSGPAYFFYLMELLIQAASELGLDRQLANRLVKRTALAAANLVIDENVDPAMLRERVTSPNGTTQAALETFQKHGMRDAIIKGVRAAQKRSIEISKEMDSC